MSSISSPRRFARPILIALALVAVAAVMPLVGGAVTLQLPQGVTKQQAYSMYAEQLDSQAAIGDLVAGDISRFVVTKRSVTASSAALTLDVTYDNGMRRRGTMRMFKVGDVWYFRSITNGVDTPERMGSVATADVGVVNTILAEQAAHAPVAAKFVSGEYKKVILGAPKTGFNSVERPVTFAGSGARAKAEKGRVTCIAKTIDGEQVWFITGFAK